MQTKTKFSTLIVLFITCHLIKDGSAGSSRLKNNTSSRGTNERKSESHGLSLLGDIDERTLTKMGGQMTDIFSNLTSLFSGIKSELGNSTSGGCGVQALAVWEAVKIPIFVIAPAIILGIAILIKAIAFGVAYLPAITAPLFKGLMSKFSKNKHHSMGWSDHHGYPPSQGYGPPPSPSYGAPSTLQRQTGILEAISNLSNMYGDSQNYISSDDGQQQQQGYYDNNVGESGQQPQQAYYVDPSTLGSSNAAEAYPQQQQHPYYNYLYNNPTNQGSTDQQQQFLIPQSRLGESSEGSTVQPVENVDDLTNNGRKQKPKTKKVSNTKNS